jgi:glutamate-1-semialdehyde aminotransferase
MKKLNTVNLKKSKQLIREAKKVIPGCSQSFSKGLDQYVRSVSPHYITKGKGCQVWDVDGNRFLDFTMGLAPLILGYCDPDVNEAVMTQLNFGTIFSLSNPLEIELAKKLIEIIPCAEMVRFGKNGSDATTGAVRLARAYTDRDLIASCGYHGWHDWYIGTTYRYRGIPRAVRKLTKTFNYNNIDSLKKLYSKYPDQIACVIMEPMTVFVPKNNFLQDVCDIAHENGSIVIFDEVITGFRLALGGAQEYFNVTPDLACVAKAMANGFPISAVVGKSKIMSLFEEVFFSFTFAGEVASVAASLATIKKLEERRVIEFLWKQGNRILERVNALIKENKIEHRLSCVGLGPRSVFLFRDENDGEDWLLRSYMQQECIKRGLLFYGCHNLSFAHKDEVLNELFNIYDKVIPLMAEAIHKNDINNRLIGNPVRPVFRRPL